MLKLTLTNVDKKEFILDDTCETVFGSTEDIYNGVYTTLGRITKPVVNSCQFNSVYNNYKDIHDVIVELVADECVLISISTDKIFYYVDKLEGDTIFTENIVFVN